MRPVPLLAALAALAASAAGCLSLSCQPHLDVRHCLPEQAGCVPAAGDATLEWDAAWAARWPDVDRLLRETPEGKHGHDAWNASREAAWWQAAGVDPGEGEPKVHVRLDGAWFRVRVLSC